MLPAHVAERFPPLFRRLTPGRLCDRALSLKLAPRFIPTLSRERAAVGWSLPSFLGRKYPLLGVSGFGHREPSRPLQTPRYSRFASRWIA